MSDAGITIDLCAPRDEVREQLKHVPRLLSTSGEVRSVYNTTPLKPAPRPVREGWLSRFAIWGAPPMVPDGDTRPFPWFEVDRPVVVSGTNPRCFAVGDVPGVYRACEPGRDGGDWSPLPRVREPGKEG